MLTPEDRNAITSALAQAGTAARCLEAAQERTPFPQAKAAFQTLRQQLELVMQTHHKALSEDMAGVR